MYANLLHLPLYCYVVLLFYTFQGIYTTTTNSALLSIIILLYYKFHCYAHSELV